jgi:hypothetical protein
MKDAKGHGSNARGGASFTSKRQIMRQITNKSAGSHGVHVDRMARGLSRSPAMDNALKAIGDAFSKPLTRDDFRPVGWQKLVGGK